MKNTLPIAILAVASVLTLAGCAGITPGVSTERDVIALWGKPVEQRERPDGTRVLEYPREPLGYQNWRVTLDKGGVVQSAEQLLDEPHLARLTPKMTFEEVLGALGRPSETRVYSNLNEKVVSWLIVEFGYRRMYFNAHFDSESGLLKYTSRTPDPTQLMFGGKRR